MSFLRMVLKSIVHLREFKVQETWEANDIKTMPYLLFGKVCIKVYTPKKEN